MILVIFVCHFIVIYLYLLAFLFTILLIIEKFQEVEIVDYNTGISAIPVPFFNFM